jgi:hypothetical protein
MVGQHYTMFKDRPANNLGIKEGNGNWFVDMCHIKKQNII